jgi:hypothetical protein
MLIRKNGIFFPLWFQRESSWWCSLKKESIRLPRECHKTSQRCFPKEQKPQALETQCPQDKVKIHYSLEKDKSKSPHQYWGRGEWREEPWAQGPYEHHWSPDTEQVQESPCKTGWRSKTAWTLWKGEVGHQGSPVPRHRDKKTEAAALSH